MIVREPGDTVGAVCPACGGVGMIEEVDPHGNPIDETCPVCDGEKTFEAVIAEPIRVDAAAVREQDRQARGGA